MDLLESILRTARAEEYIRLFRDEDVGANSLKMLNDEDLKMMGIEDAETRQRILKEAESLVITSETPTRLNFDVEYANGVLVQMPNILKLHYGNLYNALNRTSVLNCDTPLEPSMVALLSTIGDLKQELRALKVEVDRRKPKSSKKKKIIIASILGFLICANVFYMRKMLR